PVLTDGSEGRFGDMWIRLAEGPATLRAFAASLPQIYAAIQKLDAYMVGAGEWKAAPKADAPAPAAKPAAKPAAPKPAAAPAPALPRGKDACSDSPSNRGAPLGRRRPSGLAASVPALEEDTAIRAIKSTPAGAPETRQQISDVRAWLADVESKLDRFKIEPAP